MKTKMASEAFYQGLDQGIRFAVRVLHANGFDTCQSCAGSGEFGSHSGKRKGDEHAYLEPTVDMPLNTDHHEIFGALAALAAYGLPVASVAIVWNVQHGLINEKI